MGDLRGLEGADVELRTAMAFLARLIAALEWPLGPTQRERVLGRVKELLARTTALRAKVHRRVHAEPALAAEVATLTAEYDRLVRLAHRAASASPPPLPEPTRPFPEDWPPDAVRSLRAALLVVSAGRPGLERPSTELREAVRAALRAPPAPPPLEEDTWAGASDAAWSAHLLAWVLADGLGRSHSMVFDAFGTTDVQTVDAALATRSARAIAASPHAEPETKPGLSLARIALTVVAVSVTVMGLLAAGVTEQLPFWFLVPVGVLLRLLARRL